MRRYKEELEAALRLNMPSSQVGGGGEGHIVIILLYKNKYKLIVNKAY